MLRSKVNSCGGGRGGVADGGGSMRAVQMTFQDFIDDLFRSILSVDAAHLPLPAAVKYLFDFFDSAADRHGVNDANVVHAWKTNR